MAEPADDLSFEAGNLYDADLSDMDIPDYNDTPAVAKPDSGENEPEPVAAAELDADPDEPGEPAAKPEAEVKAAAEAAAAAKAVKKIGFKAGDQSIELLEDAVTDWKVDGQPVKVPLKELLQNYSGKVAWEKRFQEVADARKQTAEQVLQFEQQKQRHSQLITDMHKAAQEGRTFDAISAMIQMTGAKVDAREYVKNLRSALVEQAKQMAGLTPEQLQVQEAKEELEYLKSQGTRLQQQRAQEQAAQAFQARVATAINSVNSTIDEYVSTRDWLLKNGPAQLGNQWDPQQVTPEYVANQIRDVRDYRTVREALDTVDPSLAKNQTTWKQAVEMLRSNPDWTVDDVKEVYREALKQKRSQTLSNKVAKAPVATTATASTAKPRKAHREDWSVFDERDLAW